MKKLLFILLCVPLVGFGQSFDFNDIKKINSEKKFSVFALENRYSIPTGAEELVDGVQYAYKDFVRYDEGDFVSAFSSSWLYWSKEYNLFSMDFYLGNEETKKIFEKIISQIKSECEFYDIIKGMNLNTVIERVNYHVKKEHLCYTCPNSKYKGKITFYISGNTGYIETVNPLK